MRMLQCVLGYLDLCQGAPWTVSTKRWLSNRGTCKEICKAVLSRLSLCSNPDKGPRRARVHCLAVCGGAGAIGEKAA